MPRIFIHPKNKRRPVVIVGAGPVGLFLANLLGSKKIPTLVFEKRSRREILRGSRAIGITAPSLRLLGELGLLSDLKKRGVFIREAEVFENGKPCGHLDFRLLPKPWLPTLSVPQYETTRVLLKGIERFQNVNIFWETSFIRATTTADVIKGSFRFSNGRTKTMESDFLVGCDGHRSQVREAMKIPYSEKSSREAFLMADFKGRHPLGQKAALFFSKHGAVESFPMTKDLRRWIVQLGPERWQTRKRFNTELAASPKKLALYLATEVKKRAGFSVSGLNPDSFQWFRPRRTETKNYFQNRVLLCGDAAHVISPIGAQGMNSGFLGAAKIAQIIDRHAPFRPNKNPSSTSALLTQLKRYQTTQKKLVSTAGRRAELHMWIGTRIGLVFSLLRKWVTSLLLTRFFSPYLAKRFAMLDLIDRSMKSNPENDSSHGRF